MDVNVTEASFKAPPPSDGFEDQLGLGEGAVDEVSLESSKGQLPSDDKEARSDENQVSANNGFFNEDRGNKQSSLAETETEKTSLPSSEAPEVTHRDQVKHENRIHEVNGAGDSNGAGATPASSKKSEVDDKLTNMLESFRNKNFAEKLHALLSIPAYATILRWNSSGDAFAIYDTTEFVNVIMATHFQRAKFDSFTRRMRRWGFRRMESMEEKMKGLVIYRSKCFHRDKPELCKMMCDDRQWKNKERAIPSAAAKRYAPPNVVTSPRHQIKGHGELVPVHIPQGHPDHVSNNWSHMPAPYPLSPTRQFQYPAAAQSFPHMNMDRGQSANQSYSMGMMYPPPQQPYFSQGMQMPMMYHPMMPMQHHNNMNMMMQDPQQRNGDGGYNPHMGAVDAHGQFPAQVDRSQKHHGENQGRAPENHQAEMAQLPLHEI